ncbi:hypothetical protein Tco_0999991 [Tanacetum coccineum]
MKALPFMAPFPANYRETMPWVVEKPFVYSVEENTCNEANMYDLDETGEGIVKGNFLYVKKDPSCADISMWSSSTTVMLRYLVLSYSYFPILCFVSFCRIEDNAKLKCGGVNREKQSVFASLFVAKYKKNEEKNEEIKFYTSLKNPKSRLEIRSISRVQEPTIELPSPENEPK